MVTTCWLEDLIQLPIFDKLMTIPLLPSGSEQHEVLHKVYYKLNYEKQNALYSGVANLRKMGLKIALFTI